MKHLQTKGLVSLCGTLRAIEEVLLYILEDREPGAASGVGGSVLAVGASYSLSDRGT